MTETEGQVIAAKVTKLFPNEFKGKCIDVGAHHPTWLSNSYDLEVAGWDVYCIEANPYCIDELKSGRANVIECAVGRENRNSVPFYVYKAGHGVNGMAGYTGLSEKGDSDLAIHGAPGASEIIHVDVRSLDWILSDLAVSHVDCISIDVEGTEMDVLGGACLEKYRPKVIVIENIDPGDTRQRDYLFALGYQAHDRYIYNDIYVGGL